VLLSLVAATGLLALLTVVPGPDMAVVTRRGLAGGRSDGIRAAAGVVTGLLVWGGLAVLGLTALLAASPTAYLVVKVLGAGYLVWLGVQALRTAGRYPTGDPVDGGAARRGRPFLTGLTTNLLNPKIAVFYSAMLPALAPSTLDGAAGLATLVAIHAALSMGWLGGYAVLLTRAPTALLRPRVRRTLDRLTGVVLIGFAVRLATESA
jgi:threonine/homoserine/homoserine lactone efflux protein